jgi:flagellar motility protein MotE (MotC chaperone)
LHVLIAAASVMLVARVGAVYHEAGIAFAQTPPAAKPTSETPAKPASESPAKPTSETPAKPAGETPAKTAEGEPLTPGVPKAPPPTTYTETEVKLLQDLAKRRAELDQRADELTQRETLLKAAEQRVDEKIDQLKQMQATVDASLGKVDAQEDQRLSSLVAIYTNMKPKEAAPILSTLDMPVLLQLLTRMKDRTTSAILAVMDPKTAQTITLALAQRRQTSAAVAADGAPNPQN